ncbi:MAG: hypothetical protein ACRERU_03075 [Methylococcales bacterium]
MNCYVEMIYDEIKRLPEPLVREVYDFVHFVEAAHPMRRDELYADRLR